MLLELCVTELEDVASDRACGRSLAQPVVQESPHPYTDDTSLSGNVKIPGAEAMRVEFDRRCSTERRHDPLTIMDGAGRTLSVRSGDVHVCSTIYSDDSLNWTWLFPADISRLTSFPDYWIAN